MMLMTGTERTSRLYQAYLEFVTHNKCLEIIYLEQWFKIRNYIERYCTKIIKINIETQSHVKYTQHRPQ